MTATRLTSLLVVLAVLQSVAWSRTVHIETGLIEGTPDGTLTVYKSVPFAAPPVGQLRWRAPEPPLTWTGVRRADKFGPICMQSGVSVPGAAEEAVNEDCLTLNIWTPATSGNDKLPVMVWIPGGGFTQESASMPLYWGDMLARRGVVVVTINYRVGVFGFLAHPELTRESPNHSSGNYGLLDQIAALAWIKRNVAAFGGDQSLVTIWGQSAGSMSVSLLMASPLARGLFQRAIGDSGGFFVPPAATGSAADWFLTGAERQGVKFAAAVGVSSTAASSIEALRKLGPQQILKASDAGTTHPIMDGYVLPEEPYDAFRAGHQNDVPLLLGSNAEEAKPLIANMDVKLTTFGDDVGKAFGGDSMRDLANEYLKIYPAKTDAEARQTRARFERDLRFGWDVWTWARMQSKTGKGEVFYYYIKHSPPYPEGSPFKSWGAGHWQELRYAFDHLAQIQWAWTDADHALANTMAAYWTNFSRSGDPNGAGVPVWPNFTTGNERLMNFDGTVAVAGVPNLTGLRLLDDHFARLRAATSALQK
ncbi:MAG TPA: carboxylesterase family protein [Terriglobales bacterium]|nr:carboxylesterase family protein [Terriglobales bacterium]